MFTIPFSDNSEVIDLVQVIGFEKLEDFPKHIPKRIMSALYWKGPLFTPNHTKDALYSTNEWGKVSKYFTSFRSLKSEFV